MSFADDLQKACDRAKDKARDLVVRGTALGLHAGMVQRAPVATEAA